MRHYWGRIAAVPGLLRTALSQQTVRTASHDTGADRPSHSSGCHVEVQETGTAHKANETGSALPVSLLRLLQARVEGQQVIDRLRADEPAGGTVFDAQHAGLVNML